MNVYDFDETIFHPDSIVAFALWELKRYPIKLIPYAIKTIAEQIKYMAGVVPRYKRDLALCRVVQYVPNMEKEAGLFWDVYEKDISKWYLEQRRPDDVVISASPEALLKPLADRLGFKLIATQMDPEYGVLIGNVMVCKEKAKYIIDQGMPMIENFYSDSLTDAPLALLAENAYQVVDKAKRVIPWPDMEGEQRKIVKDYVDDVYKVK